MTARVGGPGYRRGVAYAIALLAHLVVLGAMSLGLHQADRPAQISALNLDLTPIDPTLLRARKRPPPRPVARLSGQAEPRVPAPPAPAVSPLPSVRPAPPAATPPTPRIGPGRTGPSLGPSLAPGPDPPARAALRTSSGCDSADFLNLKAAERAACETRDAGLRAKNHQTYAVISQEKKDFFDGACKRDDDWCLYRTGQGPYPGLRGLLDKRH